MPNFRRAWVPGGTFFFTLVTADRAPILCSDLARPILHDAIARCAKRLDFEWTAGVLLPDHLHALWTLPPGDADFSTRWAMIKWHFTAGFIRAGGMERSVSANDHRQRNRGVWQRRFYEHLIRDKDDLHRHLDYIHYNPVKHGLATCPHAWEHSTFHRAVLQCDYDPAWGCCCDGRSVPSIDFDWVNDDME